MVLHLKTKGVNHCMENHIFFFRTSWKDRLSKKISLEYDLSCIIGKDDISFSRNHDLTPWTENERLSFSRKYMEIWCFLQMFRKDCSVFSKRIDLTGKWSFLYYLEKWFFFPENMIFFPQAENERWSFSRNARKYDILYVLVRVLQTWHLTPLRKKSRMILSCKNIPKGGWLSRLSF